MKVIEKPWGREEILEVNSCYMVKRLFMKSGSRCSLQYHKNKRETIVVISGTLLIARNHIEDITLYPGDYLTIIAGQKHRMEGVTDVIYLEASTPEQDDVVRIRDDYGRE